MEIHIHDNLIKMIDSCSKPSSLEITALAPSDENETKQSVKPQPGNRRNPGVDDKGQREIFDPQH